MKLAVGNFANVMNGKVVCISEYPKLGLTYYGIEYYDFRRRLTEIVFIEKNKLENKLTMREVTLSLIKQGYKLKDILKTLKYKKSEVISYGFINEKYLFEDGSFVMTIFDKVY